MKTKIKGDMRSRRREGFSLLEVIVGITLVAIAVLGLAEMFTLGILNNLRAERIASANFLAQQQVDVMRNLSADELTVLTTANGVDLNGDGSPDIMKDELLDINSDSQFDYRRITELQSSSSGPNMTFEISVFVFSAERLNTPKAQLILQPVQYGVKSKVNTVIGR